MVARPHVRVGQCAGVLARVDPTEGEHAVSVRTRGTSDGRERDAELLCGDEALGVCVLDDGRDARVLIGRERAASQIFGAEAEEGCQASMWIRGPLVHAQ